MGYKSLLRGYWNKLENILAEAKRAKRKLKVKRLPNSNILRGAGYSSLTQAIYNYYPNKYDGLRKDLGEVSTHRRKSYRYFNPKNIEKEVARIMKEKKLSLVPSADFLREIGEGSLATTIYVRYPGAYGALREHFGEEIMDKPSDNKMLEGLLRKYASEE